MNTLLKASSEEIAELRDLEETKGSRRIMVVDDDTDLRNLIAEALALSGYEVDAAENAIRAWKAIHVKRYDLLITDHDMPGMKGLQLVQKLRSAGFELPVLFASGTLPVDVMARNTWLTSAIMLPKPFTLGELTRTVKELLPNPASDFNSNPGDIFPNLGGETSAAISQK